MKAYLVFGSSGPIVVLTSHGSLTDADLLKKLAAKGLEKFLAYEVPIDLARQRYGTHFEVVTRDLNESDDLRVLDYSGGRAFRTFRFAELGEPIMHNPDASTV
jgi:hypothetical protein